MDELAEGKKIKSISGLGGGDGMQRKVKKKKEVP